MRPLTILNLTPHEVRVYGPNGEGPVLVLPSRVKSQGGPYLCPRVDVLTRGTQVVRFAEPDANAPVGWAVQVRQTELGEPVGLPEPQPGTVFVVSRMVAEAAPERRDFVYPDEIVRDGKGRIVGCAGFGSVHPMEG